MNNPNQNKVYINPNFKKKHVPQQTSMHFNPKFMLPSTKELSINQLLSNGKVFINPNFLNLNSKPHTVVETTIDKPDTNHIVNTTDTCFNKVSMSRYSFVRQCVTPIECKSILQLEFGKTPPVHKIAKSRYAFVKQRTLCEVSYNSTMKGSNVSQSKRTCKNKHIQNIRNNSINKPSVVKTRYKIVKKLVSHPKSTPLSVSKKVCPTKVIRTTPKMKIEANKKLLKKNNIPCPLFKKYGKCLRSAIGKCEYLHDKKHVRICRRFLVGSCYDEDCFFSHNITSNKMPTCSFYLKGICTKVACPYLHVKLNEKSEICTDFLKGYCEKGSNCLKKHINICPNLAAQQVCFRKNFPYPHNNSNKNVKRASLKHKRNNDPKTKTQILNKKIVATKQKDEIRYYKDTSDDNNIKTQEIKPRRCKLGTLPSYIRL